MRSLEVKNRLVLQKERMVYPHMVDDINSPKLLLPVDLDDIAVWSTNCSFKV